mmetsp:Transcript_12224/g.15181  ORF Transcript_12224/g.15181 Transcript_12224/m.15181 type:complete len:104 (+) Transcript_12224:437-748(+)
MIMITAHLKIPIFNYNTTAIKASKKPPESFKASQHAVAKSYWLSPQLLIRSCFLISKGRYSFEWRMCLQNWYIEKIWKTSVNLVIRLISLMKESRFDNWQIAI